MNGARPLVVAISLLLLAPAGHAAPQGQPAALPRGPGAAPAVRGPRPFTMIPPRGYRVVERPARIACTLETDRFVSPVGFQVDFPLTTAPGGRTFATIRAGAVRVLVPAGSLLTPYVVEAEVGGLFLRGHLGPSVRPERGAGAGALLVRPSRRILLGGLYWPSRQAVLRLTRDARHGFVVAPTGSLPRSLVLERGVLPAAVPCTALSLDRTSSELEPSSPGAKTRRVAIAEGATLPLLDRPGGRRLATIKVGPGDHVRLDVSPAHDGHALVAWALEEGTVTGHVPVKLLALAERPVSGELGRSIGRIPYLLGMGRAGRSPDPSLRCQDDVLLGVELPPAPGTRRSPERVIVGGFRAGTRIRTEGQDADSTTVWSSGLPYDVGPAVDVRFFLPRRLLGACRPN